MPEDTKVPITAFVCGPQDRCGCQCPDGPCGHDFSGPPQQVDKNTFSQVCSKCGMSAFEHSLWVGP